MESLADIIERKRASSRGMGDDGIISFHSSHRVNPGEYPTRIYMSSRPSVSFLEAEEDEVPPRSPISSKHGSGRKERDRKGKARSRKSRKTVGQGRSAKKLAMLSGKTDKIMNSYKDYLDELECENIALRSLDDIADDEGGNVPDPYEGKLFMTMEEGSTEGSSSSSSASRNEAYAAAAGALQRAWSYEKSDAYVFDDDQYARKWLRARRLKRGITLIALAAVVLGVILVGVIGSGNRNDVKYGTRTESGDEIEVDMKATSEVTAVGSTSKSSTPHHVLHGPQSASAEKGSRGVDFKFEEEEVAMPSESIPSPPLINAEEDPYSLAAKKFQPVIFDSTKGYTGKSYRDALEFCAGLSLAICPYDAVCPEQFEGEPLGGFRESAHGDWVWIPIIDSFNEFVQVGARERCAKYSQKFGKGPGWGITGEDEDEGEVVEGTNVMCCKNVM